MTNVTNFTCQECPKGIPANSDHIEIRWNRGGGGVLRFHAECFQAVAGEEFVPNPPIPMPDNEHLRRELEHLKQELERAQQARAYEELRKMAMQQNIAISTAQQPYRSGKSAAIEELKKLGYSATSPRSDRVDALVHSMHQAGVLDEK